MNSDRGCAGPAPGRTGRELPTTHPTGSWRGRLLLGFWRLFNPLMRPLAGLAPWWVLVETRGRKTGRTRRTPLAVGRRDSGGLWVIAVHGHRSAWVLNAAAKPAVRYRHMLRWHEATANLHDWDQTIAATMGLYARSGAYAVGEQPLLVELRRS